MENILLVVILLLLVISILINLFFKNKNQDLNNKVEYLQSNLSKFESNLKEDFRTNREENAMISKDNRLELNNNIQNFTTDQHQKFIEFKKTQTDFAIQTFNQLEIITTKIENKLFNLNEQSKIDANLMRESLSKSFVGFGDNFDKSINSFNDLQKSKFADLEKRQNDFDNDSRIKFASIFDCSFRLNNLFSILVVIISN